jgi:hypothetical protein
MIYEIDYKKYIRNIIFKSIPVLLPRRKYPEGFPDPVS